MIGEAPGGAAAAAHAVARLIVLAPGCYAFRLAGVGSPVAVPGLALPAVEICAAPQEDGAIDIANASGRASSWLGAGQSVLFVTARGGGTALITGFLPRDPGSARLTLDVRRIAAPGGAAPSPAQLMTLDLGGPVETAADHIGLDVVAHVRGRGDVRFLDTPWVGRLGTGLWIEAITLLPHDREAAAAIEYKGLTASGAETPWLASGSPCGTRGQGTPLVGFAVRQKAGSGGALFDCEYTGYFASGATAGPARNGAPCRSVRENDALEGLQLRIAPRPPPARA